MVSMIFRSWVGQHFVVSMQFRFLLKVSIVASFVTLAGFMILGFALDYILLALAFVIVGELVSLLMFYRQQRNDSSLLAKR